MVLFVLIFMGCVASGYLIGCVYADDDKTLKGLSYFIAILMLTLSIIAACAWRNVIVRNTIFDHYGIVQEETITKTYKIIPYE